ncbi:putative B3 domain-containing protein Os03g0621600 [Lolium perenne]|uniref:putative B3 domain-containing protein Os03g0621600 n=1 Tax=Lolium perenne TaxID=4522 RepID=UPI0021F58D72|nr:putative B3 domain-containing protein Os03g0621600 [Lolium perenne]
MDKSCGCETCKKWAEHYYWDLSDDEGKCFFKVIMDDLHEMTIPEKFAQRFKGKISGTIKLEVRSGSICNVSVETCADKMILQSGWDEFVSKHDIGKGDFLVFRYNGDSQFKVGIFDPSGCEKALSCVSINNPPPAETVESSYEHHSRRSLDNTMEKSSSSTPSEPGDACASQDDLIANNIPPYMIAHNVHLTPVQKDKVEEVVQDINSDIPVLVTMMCKSNVNREQCKFAFWKIYCDMYLPQEKQRVVLQRNGKRWTMWLNGATSPARSLIHGWRRFVLDNDLQVGDICLFDLLNNKKMCTMNVHIICAMKRGRR